MVSMIFQYIRKPVTVAFSTKTMIYHLNATVFILHRVYHVVCTYNCGYETTSFKVDKQPITSFMTCCIQRSCDVISSSSNLLSRQKNWAISLTNEEISLMGPGILAL